jgi:hypothetical protein
LESALDRNPMTMMPPLTEKRAKASAIDLVNLDHS